MTPDMWHGLAEDVLAPLLVEDYMAGENNFFDYAYHEAGLTDALFPPGRWRSLYAVVVALRLDGEPLNWNTVSERVVSTVSEDWFADIVTLADALRLSDFESNVEQLILLGERMRAVERLECAAEELRRGAEVRDTLDRAVAELALSSNHRVERETAEGSFGRVAGVFEDKPDKAYPTGFEFIDRALGGMYPGRLMMLVGAYKSHKTQTSLNFLLNAYFNGASCAFLTLENSIEMTALQVISMLAIRWLLANRHLTVDAEPSVWNISGDVLTRTGRNYRQWNPLRKQAVDYAREELAQMGDRVRFYDRSADGGALGDVASIRAVMTRDMRLYGGDWYCIDHQGLIDASGEIYESTRYVSKEMQKLSRMSDPRRIFLCVLSQMSEAAIKAKKAYSSGAKGGGDTNANADYVLRTMPIRDPSGGDDKYYDDRVKLQVKHNRWGESTGFQQVFFHPQSGLHTPDTRDEESSN